MKINFITINKIVYWIVIIWFQRVPNSIDHARTWINQVERWNKENGPIWTIAYIKMMKQLVMSYLSDKPQKEVKMIIGINRLNGLPKQISYLHNLIESRDPLALRYIFTLLSISRAIPGWKDPDLSTITNPCGADPLMIKELAEYVPIFLKDNNFNFKSFDFKLRPYFDVDNIHFSNKAGPIGRATKDALMDLLFLPNDLRETLLRSNIATVIKHYAKIFEKVTVEKWYLLSKHSNILKLPFKRSASDHARLPPKGKLAFLYDIDWEGRIKLIMNGLFTKKNHGIYHVRKLSIVQDPEAKSRVIAILDYWSQTWLLQIHSIHFNLLRLISTDRTFTQSPLITNKLSGHKYYSFDLSAATDRFPLSLQKELIKGCFGSEVSDTFESVLTKTPFYVPWEDKTITYNCGQPMGAYGSWSTFTLTHHMIVQYIHTRLNLKELYYIILGDDIVIYHDEVAKEYLRIMKALDVGISIPKTCISINMYEFAKRIFIANVEVTGIQIRGFIDNISKYHLLYQMVYTIVFERGYVPLLYRTVPDLICDLYLIMGKEYKRAMNIRSRVRLLHAFNLYILGDKTLLETYLVEHFYKYEGQLHFDEVTLNSYVYLSVMKSIESKQAEYITYAKDLHLKAYGDIAVAWGLADQADIWTSPSYLITQTPLMRALANMIESLSSAKKLDTFKDMIEVLALPSPSIFTERASTRLIGAKAKLAKRFLAEFESSVIQESTSQFYQPYLGINILRGLSSQIETLIRTTPKSHGLVPPEPAPKPPKISDMWNDTIIG
jgi:hypothetical protein